MWPWRLFARGPDGVPLTDFDLPRANERRWNASMKAKVLLAIRGGLITFQQASKRYFLSAEELSTWSERYELYGLAGLKERFVKTKPRPPRSGAKRGRKPKSAA